MLLRLSASAQDWGRVVFALETLDATILAGTVRSLLAASPRPSGAGSVALAFTPQQAGALQRVGGALGMSLLATPVAADLGPGWVSAAAERAEAVAAAEVAVRAHQRVQAQTA